MKMQFKDVPTGASIRFKPYPKHQPNYMFDGVKIEEDMAQKIPAGNGYMACIRPDEVVEVVFRDEWRITLLLVSDWIRHLTDVAARKAERGVRRSIGWPASLLSDWAQRGLNFRERTELHESLRPFQDRKSKLQKMYDEAFNTRTPDLSIVAPAPHGLVSDFMEQR